MFDQVRRWARMLTPLEWVVSTLLLLFSLPVHGTEFYVAPLGSPAGDGSRARPWDIQTALYQPPAIKAGDVIWLRGGTYRAPWTNTWGRSYFVRLTGSATAPILVKGYPGENAIVDGGIHCRPDSQYYQFWGLRITDSDTNRLVTCLLYTSDAAD